MQAIVENGKVIANGVAYLVPSVKDGTKVVLTLNAYSSKFCLVNYKDKKGITRSEKAIAEFMMPDERMQTTTGRVPSPIFYGETVAKKTANNPCAERKALMQRFKIKEFARINQETYLELVKHVKLGVPLTKIVKILGINRATVERYRDIYHRVNAGGYELVLIPNTVPGKKSLSVCTLKKIGGFK